MFQSHQQPTSVNNASRILCAIILDISIILYTFFFNVTDSGPAKVG